VCFRFAFRSIVIPLDASKRKTEVCFTHLGGPRLRLTHISQQISLSLISVRFPRFPHWK